MNFLKNLFKRLFNKKQKTQDVSETIEENITVDVTEVNSTKVYIDNDMADEIVKILHTMGDDKIKK
jgi:hypothetical protein